MTAAALKSPPAPEVADTPRPRVGRPPGCLTSPLSRWLRLEIRQAKRDRWTCRDAFFLLATQNREVAGGKAFLVGAETASEVWVAVCGDIKNARVSYDYFRRLWRES